MLKLHYFGHLIQGANSLEMSLVLGKIEGQRRKGWQRIRWLDSISNPVDMNLSKLWEIEEGRGTWCVAVHGVAKSRTRLSEFHFHFTSTVSSKAWPQNTTLKLTIMRLFSRRFVFPLLLFLRPPKSCPTLCYSMDFTTPGSSVLLYLPEFAQIHVH